MYLLRQSVILWFLIVFETDLIPKSLSEGVKSRLNSDLFVKHDFAWTRVSAYPCVVKQLANPVRWFIYVLIITGRNLIEFVPRYFNDFEPACGGVDHCHAGQTNIITSDSAAWLLLYYKIAIWSYQVYMHQIPRFQFCYVLRLQISIKSLYIFEPLTYLERLRIHICLRDKSFPIIYLLNCFCKSINTWVVEIEMVPVYHMVAQIFCYVYFVIIAEYIDFVKILHGVTGWLTRNACTEFEIYISNFFSLFSL